MTMQNFSYTDLSLLGGEARAFDGMSAGVFTDMFGRETEFRPEELPAYVANTKRALESTRDSAGEVVGFPIDQLNHHGGLAAGWIVDVALAEGRNVIEFTPRWNDWAREKITANELRFFSPSINVREKVIVGGSLTNWPATRTPDEQILLRPVELSAQMQTYDTPPQAALLGEVLKRGLAEIKQIVLSGLKPTPDEPQLSEGVTMPEETVELQEPQAQTVDLASPEIQAEIDLRAEAKAAVIVAQRAHEAQVSAFAASLVHQGVPVGAEELVAFLSKLPAEVYPEAERLLGEIATKGLIQFEEQGHSKVATGSQPLPDWTAAQLSKWLAAGKPLGEFFEVNADVLGAMSDYNLTEYQKEQ
jgi:hypothetical protein